MGFLFLGLGLLAAIALESLWDDDNGSDTDPESETENIVLGRIDLDDWLEGTEGSDTLTGNVGDADTLVGGDGDDVLHAKGGNTVEAGSGADRIIADASFLEDPSTITLYPGTGADTITVSGGSIQVLGGDGAETVDLSAAEQASV